MEHYTDLGPEKHASLGLNCNKSHHSLNSTPQGSAKPNSDIGVEVASKYIGRGSEPYNPKGPKSVEYSSDDDSETEFSSNSLMALAVKLKNKTLTSDKKSSLVSPQIVLPSTAEKSRYADSSDSSSETEGSTLVGLMKKNTIKETCVVDGCLDSKLENLKVEEITTKYVSSNFSDDSDNSEPVSLMGLAMKHAHSVNVEGTGSADDVQCPCPRPGVKALQTLTSYHRQHTKSESDRYSSGTAHPSDSLIKKNLENNVSTSLKSLRGGGYSDKEFQFSPGGSIPGSFKSLYACHSLNSSLTSVDVETNSKMLGSSPGVCDFDPDFTLNLKYKFSLHDPTDVGRGTCLVGSRDEGGINLSCALKKSTSEILTSEGSNENIDGDEDEKIITLLDSMLVDEDAVEDGKVKERQFFNREEDESCSIDISHVLELKIKLRTRKCTSFGKVVCRKWRSLRSPYIKKVKRRTSVIPFSFEEPSPDDRIAYAFKRRL